MIDNYQFIFLEMFKVVLTFLSWTFLLYWIHRIIHRIPIVNQFHQDHHIYINRHGGTTWHWNNIFLYNDTWKSTVDLWISEVLPTLVFSLITGCWWLSIFYYLWAAFLQEALEHNPSFDMYPLITSGKWHLVHHRKQRKNFGLFIPLWDKLFKTELVKL